MAVETVLGIDVGTTSVKAGLIGADGTQLGQFAEAYPTHRSGQNIVEQNPEDWVRLIRRAMAQFADHKIAAIGLCSQVNTHVFVDAQGEALMPAILWQDGRAGAEAAALDARVSAAQKVKWWGAPMPIDASHAISRMAWVARHRPEIWEKTRYVMLPKDYCMLRLTGQASTDPLSNIGLVDTALNYIDEVLDLVPGARARMAPLVGTTEVAGQVTEGPFADCPVISGTMDAWAGLVGTGGACEGATIYLSGTSEIMGISSATVVPTPGAIVFPECNGLRLHAAPTQSGGDAKMWFAQTVGLTLEGMSQMVAETPRSTATPLFLPQLEGERAPLWDADLRAAFLGVSRKTTLPDLSRAVYEGVALAARHALEVLKTSAQVESDVIFCGGGGFRSEAWSQIRADVLGVPLRTLATGEPGVLGAATLAAIGIGAFDGIAEAFEILARFDATYAPNELRHEHYNALFEIYKEAVTTQADIGKRLSTLGSEWQNAGHD
ncbi:MAG: FGGY family carbohydrate kinase [Pseudomonadota bacterium]